MEKAVCSFSRLCYMIACLLFANNAFSQTDGYLLFKQTFKEDDELLKNMDDYFVQTSDYRINTKSSYTCSFSYEIKGSNNKYLLIVDSYVYDGARGQIIRYATDINNALNYTVIIYVVSNEDHTDVKDLLIYERENLVGATFIGDIDEALFEMYEGEEYSSWLCDLYFMDLDGVWSDTDGNGIYDSHTGDVKPEIIIGRISAKNTSGNTSQNLINFFNKDHQYWIGITELNKKYSLTYTNKDWANSSTFDDTKKLYGASNNDIIKYGNSSFSKSDYLSRLQNDRYEFIQLAAHSNPRLHNINNEYAYSSEIYAKNTKTIGLNLFCCSACDWRYCDYIAGAYLFNSNSRVLSLVGSTKTGSMLGFKDFYIPLGQGKTIGYSLKKWWIDYCGNSHDNNKIHWHYGMVILGDPLISFYYDQKFPVAENMDLYIKDDCDDLGNQPNSTAQYLYLSEDIWIRNQRDGLYHQSSENPNYGNPGHKAYVYVRVRNKSIEQSLGNELLVLNWAKAGVDLYWPLSWDSYSGDNIPMGGAIGTKTIPTLIGGESCVLEFEWEIPDPNLYVVDKWHFCLLAQIDNSTLDPLIGRNTFQPTWEYASYNNNVAWKNVSVININYPSAVVRISNPFTTHRPIKIRYIAKKTKTNTFINKSGEVRVKLHGDLYTLWKKSGSHQNGFKDIGNNTLLIVDTIASLDSINLPPQSAYLMEAEVSFYTQNILNDTIFEFDIVEESNNKIIGGEHYEAYRDDKINFKATALDDQEIIKGDMADIYAQTINEDASYTWFMLAGDTVSTNEVIHTMPLTSTSYILEVKSLENGYKDYDTVSISVISGKIIAVTPNPATGQTVVGYRLSDEVSSASIVVTNAMGVVYHSSAVTSSTTLHTVSLQGMPTGQYFVRLEVNGVVQDVKTLIVQ